MPSRIEGRASSETTIGGLLKDIANQFDSAGIDNPRLDARVLIAYALEMEPSRLFTKSDDFVESTIRNNLKKLVERRLASEPVSRIIGRREFWSLDFSLTPETLDPRPDTETLVDAVLGLKPMFGDQPVRILDLGTGTGCILLAILSDWPMASGVGVDVSMSAVGTATANAARLDLNRRAMFAEGNWSEGLEERFDIVVSNPPYIAESERSALPAEVLQYDPSAALFGGADGLDAYRQLLPLTRNVLKPSGYLAIEIGAQQEDAVTELLASAGFGLEARKQDLSKIVRCLVARPI